MDPAISRILFGIAQRRAGAKLYERIKELQATEFVSRSELEGRQLDRLRRLVRTASRHVPYYRRVWTEHGIDPPQIQTFDDLKKLPFLTKSDVQQHYDELIADNIGSTPLHRGKTSGSSGTPMRFLRTQDSKARFWAAQYRSYGWFGIRPGDRQGRFYGMPFAQSQSTRERLKDFVMNRKRLHGIFDLADARLAEFADSLNRFRPVYFNGYSTWLGRFADFISQQDPSHYNWIPLRAVVATSEVLSDHHRALIEQTFGCPIINEYGAAEIGLVASTCPAGGFHTVPENNIVEQIQPEVPHGIGEAADNHRELVVTDLFSDAMPFIRYRVGDFVDRVVPDEAVCSCGRSARLLGPVQGRTTHYILTPEGEIRSGMIFDYMVKLSIDDDVGVAAGCAKQTDIKTIVMYVVRNERFSDRFIRFVREQARKNISAAMTVEFEFVDELPRSATGKLQIFSTDIDIAGERARISGKPA